MGIKNNCFTYALGVEEAPDLVRLLKYESAKTVIPRVLNNLGFECREVTIDAPLYEGEWRIFFAGLYLSKYILFGYRYEEYEYHFARECEDGKWRQRDRGKPIVGCDIHSLVTSCICDSIPYYFFAVKRRDWDKWRRWV